MHGATIKKKFFSHISFHFQTKLLEIAIKGCDVINQILLR
jgi:hypothetical protein